MSVSATWCRALGLAAAAAAACAPLHGAVVPVSTTAQLVAAIAAAQPGAVITLAPGTYDVSSPILCDRPGTPDASIVVRSAAPGGARLRVSAVEGFKVSAPYWTFENLWMEGVCADHDDCEHAFHVVEGADFLVLRNNRLSDFNAQVKGNGEGDPYVFPDDVLIVGNELHDTAPRQTANPVTKIDVVGGRRWVVRGNFIHDFAKAGGDEISYAAFLKGGSYHGLFERNLVICERDHQGGVRVGLSFGGGGGTGPGCEDGICSPLHRHGVMRNNLVLHCPADVGIYLNEAYDARIYGNTLYRTTGIDVRFPSSVADLRNNVLSGPIRNRDGGVSTEGANLESVGLADFDAWFADPAAADFTLVAGESIVDQGERLVELPDDYCGAVRRSGSADRGAVEYQPAGTTAPCDTSRAGGGTELFRDGFERGGAGAWSGRSP